MSLSFGRWLGKKNRPGIVWLKPLHTAFGHLPSKVLTFCLLKYLSVRLEIHGLTDYSDIYKDAGLLRVSS